jgi:peptidoglycan/LPS O-acetylase OafA/YrhL
MNEQCATRLTYLDGIRGWASLSVVVYHATWWMLGDLNPSLRAVRILFVNDGPFAVEVFFVLSGFALSAGYFRTRRADTVRHLALRRYLRLTIPIAVSVVLAIAMARSGLFFNGAAAEIVHGKGAWLESQFVGADVSAGALKFMLYGVYDFANYDRYGPFLWTMSWEMQGSFLIFGLLLIIRPDRNDRFLWYAALLVLLLNRGSVLACFVYGVMLADLEASGLVSANAARSRLLGAIGLLLATAVVLYRALGSGDNGDIGGAYAGPIRITAAALFIAAVVMSPGLKAAFQLRVSQYLGSVSFPLYLCHGIVLCSLGSWLVLALHTAAYSDGMLSLLVPPTIIIGSLALATLLRPVERLAISRARVFSTWVLSPGFPAGLHGIEEQTTGRPHDDRLSAR